MDNILESSRQSLGRLREPLERVSRTLRAKRRPAQDTEQQKAEGWPRPQPRTQSSFLTPTTSTESLFPSYELQAQSPLFSKFPAEIRLQIWQEVVGNSSVHILLQGRGLTHVVCYEEEKPDWWRHNCLMSAWSEDYPYIGRTKEGSQADGGKLELLRSCRRIYSEAVDLLYSSNIFDFSDGVKLVDLVDSIPKQRMERITTVNLRYFHSTMFGGIFTQQGVKPHESFRNWRSIVETLKGMERLKILKLEISTEKPATTVHGSRSMLVQEKKLLTPLGQLKHIKDFTVEVNWLKEEDSIDETESWPFVLKRLTHR